MDTCTGSGSQRFLVDPSVQLVTLEFVVVIVVVVSSNQQQPALGSQQQPAAASNSQQQAGAGSSQQQAGAAGSSRQQAAGFYFNFIFWQQQQEQQQQQQQQQQQRQQQEQEQQQQQRPLAGGPCWVPLPPVTYVDSLTPGFLFYRWGVLPGVSSRYVGLLGLPFPPWSVRSRRLAAPVFWRPGRWKF